MPEHSQHPGLGGGACPGHRGGSVAGAAWAWKKEGLESGEATGHWTAVLSRSSVLPGTCPHSAPAAPHPEDGSCGPGHQTA